MTFSNNIHNIRQKSVINISLYRGLYFKLITFTYNKELLEYYGHIFLPFGKSIHFQIGSYFKLTYFLHLQK
jgi:hypothetical protein